MKKCPFCAEEIQDEAIKCKHCGEFLEETLRKSPTEDRVKWYFRKSYIVLALCCVGPLALPLIWWRPRTKTAWKVGLTIVVLLLTWIMYQATLESIKNLKELYELLYGF